MPCAKHWAEISDTVEFSAPLDLSILKDQLSPGARILDLGCGYGRISNQLHELGFSVSGYDLSSKLIARGKSKFPYLELMAGDARNISEPSHSFDAVVVSALFTTVPSPRHRSEIVFEIQRLLKSGGFVCGVDFLHQESVAYSAGGEFHSTAGIKMKHFREAELEALFFGFTDWESQAVQAASLSGKPAQVLQYSARMAGK